MFVSALIMCTTIISCTLLPCDFALVDFRYGLMWYSLAQLPVQDTEKQRQHRCDDAKWTESGNTRSEQLLMMSTEQLSRLRMAARRALEWIGYIFRYEVFPQVFRGETIHITLIFNEIQSFKTDVNQS